MYVPSIGKHKKLSYDLLGRSLILFFLVQFKQDFFYFIKHFLKSCILHFDLIPFANFRARD